MSPGVCTDVSAVQAEIRPTKDKMKLLFRKGGNADSR